MTVVPQGDTEGGNKEVNFELTFFAECLKEHEDEKPERLLHFKWKKVFVVPKNIFFTIKR